MALQRELLSLSIMLVTKRVCDYAATCFMSGTPVLFATLIDKIWSK